MKNKLTTLTAIWIVTSLLPCKAQQIKTSSPKIENYTKGELEIKITSFGENNPITIGKIMADGTIHFNWSEANLSNTNDKNYLTRSIENFYGGKFCRDSNAVVTNENAILVETKFIYLFKYDQPVGVIIPSTQIGQEHRKDQLGSTINWIYSDSETNVKANCIEKKEWKDRHYSFDETTAYDLTLKKGFNIVSSTLTAIEEWDNGKINGSLPKTIIIKTVDQIPSNMNWHVKYWANDELLEIEYQLFKLKPITKQQYESWLPKKLGNLKRTGYEIGKTLERMPTLNNVNLLFEKGSKTIDLTIVDPAGNKDAASVYTLMKDMSDSEWKDKTESGYRSSTKMDGTPVLVEYNEGEKKSILSYNAKDRFLIKAEGVNMSPEELWEYLKKLGVENLVE